MQKHKWKVEKNEKEKKAKEDLEIRFLELLGREKITKMNLAFEKNPENLAENIEKATIQS